VHRPPVLPEIELSLALYNDEDYMILIVLLISLCLNPNLFLVQKLLLGVLKESRLVHEQRELAYFTSNLEYVLLY